LDPEQHLTARDWAAHEIYSSELQYAQHLDTLVLNYLPRMKEVCSPEEIKYLFSNVVVLRNFSLKLLQELEERIRNWSPTQLIGDIFLKFFPFFKAYNQYFNNYDDAIETLVECMKRPAFANICAEELAKTPNGLGPDLQSLLVNPVQRIPRYLLLLKELVQKTPSDHPDYQSLNTALNKIKEITEIVNFGIKQFDMTKLYDRILITVDGIKQHMMPHRKFIMEENFLFLQTPSFASLKSANNFSPSSLKSTTNSSLSGNFNSFSNASDGSQGHSSFWLIMFSDMLFIASGSNYQDRKLKRFYQYNCIWLEEVSGRESNGLIFQMLTPDETYVIQTKDTAEKTKWMKTIQEKINFACKEDTTAKKRFFEFKFPNGDTYQGDWLNAKMEGKGKYTFANGKFYEGEFIAGLFEGKGIMDYGNKSVYEGEWKSGLPHGEGKFSQP